MPRFLQQYRTGGIQSAGCEGEWEQDVSSLRSGTQLSHRIWRKILESTGCPTLDSASGAGAASQYSTHKSIRRPPMRRFS